MRYVIQFKDDRQIRKIITRYFGTQTNFAKEVGITRNFVTMTLNGHKNFSLQTAKKILQVVNQKTRKNHEFEQLFKVKEK